MKILIGISGSISAYKAHDLVRALVNSGHEVKVILTSGALKFVVPEVFTYLGAKDVYRSQDDFNHKNVLHIDLSRWCDVFVIAPLSANTLSKLSSGRAEDLLTSVFLALPPEKYCLLFPAMNTLMLNHPFTKENLISVKKLKELSNVVVFPTDEGVLACDEIGSGKLPTVEEISELIPLFKGVKFLKNKKIVISTGASIAPLDPVRYLTNSSSGITGYYLAKSLLEEGFTVTVIAGELSTKELNKLIKHPSFKLIRASSVHDFKTHVLHELTEACLFFSAAALSDIEFHTETTKIKKDSLVDHIKIKPAPDVLKAVLELKRNDLTVVGFAAETELSDDILNKKLASKPVDLLIGTKVHNGLVASKTVEGFNHKTAHYKIRKGESVVFEGSLSKEDLAKKALHLLGMI